MFPPKLLRPLVLLVTNWFWGNLDFNSEISYELFLIPIQQHKDIFHFIQLVPDGMGS